MQAAVARSVLLVCRVILERTDKTEETDTQEATDELVMMLPREDHKRNSGASSAHPAHLDLLENLV